MLTKRIEKLEEIDMEQVCYWQDRGWWWIYIPKGGVGCLINHEVVENEDGTITVSPSILLQGHKDGEPVTIHGFLKQGVWINC